MMVELKNGETYSGLLVTIDHFMNMHLRDVYQINATADKFLKIPDCYIRGSSVKYIRVPEQLADMVKEEDNKNAQNKGKGKKGKKGKGKAGRGEAAGPAKVEKRAPRSGVATMEGRASKMPRNK